MSESKIVKCDVAVIGGGPGGLAAAAAAKEAGAARVLLIDRDRKAGGILQQCLHPGFGLTCFKEELTGPEFAWRFEERAKAAGVEFHFDTTVTAIGDDGALLCASPAAGAFRVQAGAVVLAMGCRERTRGAIRIPGTRPAGVYTAGSAQFLINRQNLMVGRHIVILGSGDIGMIMARRLTLQGMKVEAVVELLPYLAGLTRNRVQCLEDFGIPLLLSHTVTEILGHRRVEGVKIAQVDECRRPIAATERLIPCDTLLLSVGLIPENELSRRFGIAIDRVTNGPVVDQFMQTSRPGFFACGNVLHVNDLADNVTVEGEKAGRAAAQYAAGKLPAAVREVACRAGEGIRYVSPQKVVVGADGAGARLHFRVLAPGGAAELRALADGETLAVRKVLRTSPGEMEHLDVTLPAGFAGREIKVELKEAK